MMNLYFQLHEHAHKGMLAALGLGGTGSALKFTDIPEPFMHYMQFTMFVLASIVSIISICGWVKKTFFKK